MGIENIEAEIKDFTEKLKIYGATAAPKKSKAGGNKKTGTEPSPTPGAPKNLVMVKQGDMELLKSLMESSEIVTFQSPIYLLEGETLEVTVTDQKGVHHQTVGPYGFPSYAETVDGKGCVSVKKLDNTPAAVLVSEPETKTDLKEQEEAKVALLEFMGNLEGGHSYAWLTQKLYKAFPHVMAHDWGIQFVSKYYDEHYKHTIKVTKEDKLPPLSPTTQKIKAKVEDKLDFLAQAGQVLDLLAESCELKHKPSLLLEEKDGQYQAILYVSMGEAKWEAESAEPQPAPAQDSLLDKAAKSFMNPLALQPQGLQVKLSVDSEVLALLHNFNQQLQNQQQSLDVIKGFIQGIGDAIKPLLSELHTSAAGVNSLASLNLPGLAPQPAAVSVESVQKPYAAVKIQSFDPLTGEITLQKPAETSPPPAEEMEAVFSPELLAKLQGYFAIINWYYLNKGTAEKPKWQKFAYPKGVLMHFGQSWKGNPLGKLLTWAYTHPQESAQIKVSEVTYFKTTDIDKLNDLYSYLQQTLTLLSKEVN